MDRDQEYLDLLLGALRVCAEYSPKFGKGRGAGLTLPEFRQLYGQDSFYSWFGLDSPLMYAAHRAGGGMTSIYRQIGIGCQWLFGRILCDHPGVTPEDVKWSYTVKSRERKAHKLSLDARIPVEAVRPGALERVRTWIRNAARDLELPEPESATSALKGAVFEIRQGYKSKDSKRQNADMANAANAYAQHYLPVVLLFSTQIDDGVADRYRRSRWLLLEGLPSGTALNSTYVFCRDVIGYDLAAFLQRNSPILKKEVESILEKLLREQ